MPMDQAKWYTIFFSSGPKIFGSRNPKYWILRRNFYKKVFIHQLKEELRLKRIVSQCPFECDFFCGKKKLKKLIEEAHLLGLEDELLIFRKENLNG